MSSSQDVFEELLKQNGQSRTKARQAVFEALKANDAPLAMRELVAKSKAIDRASVYRAVELFESLNIVQRIYTGWKYKIELSDRFTAHHHHLTCAQCGKSVAINEDELERFIEDVAARHHFKTNAHQIEIQGVCADCQTA
ncbi:MAG TPA: Fur family transcriptional regulator [Candidatus Saccharimonadales bacterium]